MYKGILVYLICVGLSSLTALVLLVVGRLYFHDHIAAFFGCIIESVIVPKLVLV